VREPRLTAPLEPGPEIRQAIEIAVERAWPKDERGMTPVSGWPKGAGRSWRFASRSWATPVQLRRERPG
jgi:hypothetical protein